MSDVEKGYMNFTYAFQPYFWVGSTDDKKKANVTYYTESHKGVTLPGYYNHRAIKAHEKISNYVASHKKQKTA